MAFVVGILYFEDSKLMNLTSSYKFLLFILIIFSSAIVRGEKQNYYS